MESLSLRKEILFDKLNSDLYVEKAAIESLIFIVSHNNHIGTVAICGALKSVSEAKITEIEKQIQDLQNVTQS